MRSAEPPGPDLGLLTLGLHGVFGSPKQASRGSSITKHLEREMSAVVTPTRGFSPFFFHPEVKQAVS